MPSRSLRTVLLAIASAGATLAAALLGATPARADTIEYGMRWHLDATRFEAAGKATSAYAGNGGTIKLYTGWSADSYYGDYAAPRIWLQRQLVGGSWHNVKSVAFSKSKVIETLTPAYSTKKSKQVVRYRFVSLPYTATEYQRVLNTSYSKTVKVTYENQQRYTGFRAQVYKTIKPYCKVSAVHISKLGGEEAGEYKTGSLLVKIDPQVAGYSPSERRSVALHECAHQHQFTNYGKTYDGWQQMRKDAARIYVNDKAPTRALRQRAGEGAGYTFDPVEHSADCAMLAVNPSGYLGYGGYCNPRELAHGKALLRGKRL
jgi:hypothetical protein